MWAGLGYLSFGLGPKFVEYGHVVCNSGPENKLRGRQKY